MVPSESVAYFAAGLFTAMFLDVLFSIANYFLQKAFYLRSKRKGDKIDIDKDSNSVEDRDN